MSADHLTRRALITASLGAAGLTGCERALAQRTSEYGFRIVLELVVNGRPVSIEAIRKVVSWRHHGWVPTSNRTYSNYYGDAVAIDFADLTLFLTMGGYRQDYDGQIAPTDVWTPYTVYRRRGIEKPPLWSQPQSGLSLDLEPEELPVLVTIRGGDPDSISIVPPRALSERIPGLGLGRSRVEWTRKSPSRTDVRQRLPWAYDGSRQPEIYPHVYADPNLFGR